jgi:hypothetical protein
MRVKQLGFSRAFRASLAGVLRALLACSHGGRAGQAAAPGYHSCTSLSMGRPQRRAFERACMHMHAPCARACCSQCIAWNEVYASALLTCAAATSHQRSCETHVRGLVHQEHAREVACFMCMAQRVLSGEFGGAAPLLTSSPTRWRSPTNY